MNATGFNPNRPMVGSQNQGQMNNRAEIAGLMGGQQRSPFGFAGGASPFGSQPMPPQPGPPGGGQMPIPPSLNFQPGVGTSSPAMTNWRPPQYPPQGMPSNPNMQPMPVSASQPYMRPVTR